MNLKKYDSKLVKIIDNNDDVYEGICYYYDKEYNEFEYGRNEDSLKILNIIFFESNIKSIEEIENFTNPKYDNLELLIIDSDIDFIEDALELDEIHTDRLIRCIKDNIEKFEDKERILEIINK